MKCYAEQAAVHQVTVLADTVGAISNPMPKHTGRRRRCPNGFLKVDLLPTAEVSAYVSQAPLLFTAPCRTRSS